MLRGLLLCEEKLKVLLFIFLAHFHNLFIICEFDGNTDMNAKKKTKKNSMVSVRERTIPTERPPLVGEVIANFCG
jgi:hypothetical protein